MDFRFPVTEVFKDEITEINPNLIPSGFKGDKRALWDTMGKVTEVLNAMGEASAAAQGLNKPITTADRLRNSEHRVYLLVDKEANNGRGAITGMLKTGKKGLYVFDREGQNFQVTSPCVLDFYVHESRQRTGLGKRLFEHMMQKEDLQPAKIAIDRPSDKFLGFLNKHYNLNNPIKQMNNFVVFDGYFPDVKNGNIENNHSGSPGKKSKANGLQPVMVTSPYGRYGAPKPPCSMGQIIHNQQPTAQKSPEPTGIRNESGVRQITSPQFVNVNGHSAVPAVQTNMHSNIPPTLTNYQHFNQLYTVPPPLTPSFLQHPPPNLSYNPGYLHGTQSLPNQQFQVPQHFSPNHFVQPPMQYQSPPTETVQTQMPTHQPFNLSQFTVPPPQIIPRENVQFSRPEVSLPIENQFHQPPPQIQQQFYQTPPQPMAPVQYHQSIQSLPTPIYQNQVEQNVSTKVSNGEIQPHLPPIPEQSPMRVADKSISYRMPETGGVTTTVVASEPHVVATPNVQTPPYSKSLPQIVDESNNQTIPHETNQGDIAKDITKNVEQNDIIDEKGDSLQPIDEDHSLKYGYPPQYRDAHRPESIAPSSPKLERPRSLSIQQSEEKKEEPLDVTDGVAESEVAVEHVVEIERDFERVRVAGVETPIREGSRSAGKRTPSHLTEQGFLDLKFYHNKLW